MGNGWSRTTTNVYSLWSEQFARPVVIAGVVVHKNIQTSQSNGHCAAKNNVILTFTDGKFTLSVTEVFLGVLHNLEFIFLWEWKWLFMLVVFAQNKLLMAGLSAIFAQSTMVSSWVPVFAQCNVPCSTLCIRCLSLAAKEIRDMWRWKSMFSLQKETCCHTN